MKFIIGTLSKQKIKSARVVIDDLYPGLELSLSGDNVSSEVPDTPWEEETKTGAYNRATKVAKNNSVSTYSIGLESGLTKRYGDYYEEAWCCVIHNTISYFGYSSGLTLPEYVVKRMDKSNSHGLVLREIRKEMKIKNDKDTWGLYSGYRLLRETSLQESLRNALIQTMSAKDSLYRK